MIFLTTETQNKIEELFRKHEKIIMFSSNNSYDTKIVIIDYKPNALGLYEIRSNYNYFGWHLLSYNQCKKLLTNENTSIELGKRIRVVSK